MINNLILFEGFRRALRNPVTVIPEADHILEGTGNHQTGWIWMTC